MFGDPQTERLFLEVEELALLVLVRRDRGVMARLGLAGLLEQVEDRALALVAGVVLAAAPGERLVEDVDHALARGAGRVERAAFDQRLERALVDDLRVDPLGEVPDRLERPALRAGGDD